MQGRTMGTGEVELKPGGQVAQYEVLRKLVSGGMATVYLAREPTRRCPSAQSACEELVASVGLRGRDLAVLHRGMFRKCQRHTLGRATRN